MKRQFDLVVIGTGAAGSPPAHKCRAAGWQVAVIDELPYGGTCALRGCDPKKGAGRSRRTHGVVSPNARTRRVRGSPDPLAGIDSVQANIYGPCPGPKREQSQS